MAVFGLLEVFLAIACFVCIGHLRRRRNGLPVNWPLVGMLPYGLMHLRDIHNWATGVLSNSNCTFVFKGLWFSRMRLILTADPENVNYMLNRNFPNFPKGKRFKEIFDILGDGIFNSDFDTWKSQRKFAQMLLTQHTFKTFVVSSTRNKVKEGLMPLLEHACKMCLVVDLQEVFQRFTFDATCIIVTGHDPKCLSFDFPDVAFARALEDAEEAIFRRHITPKQILKLQKRFNVGHERKLKQASKDIDRIVGEIVKARRAEIQTAEDDVHLLSYYMAEDRNDDKFLRDTTFNFLIAGRDTTSSALVWFFWLLSTHKEVEEAIRKELIANVPPEEARKRRLFDFKEVHALPYLHGALCETLRLYPPVPFEHKAPLRPDRLPSGHRVMPKNSVLISLYSMGRMVSIWGDDCLEFKPERWFSEKGKIKHEPSYRFMAFNAGPRSCLGKEVAFTQMKMVAATVIHNYNVHALEGQVVSPRLSVILQMENGFHIRISSRWNDMN